MLLIGKYHLFLWASYTMAMLVITRWYSLQTSPNHQLELIRPGSIQGHFLRTGRCCVSQSARETKRSTAAKKTWNKHKCMYVCMHACMYVCTYVHTVFGGLGSDIYFSITKWQGNSQINLFKDSGRWSSPEYGWI
jgi:hypothetical protein